MVILKMKAAKPFSQFSQQVPYIFRKVIFDSPLIGSTQLLSDHASQGLFIHRLLLLRQIMP